MTQTQEEFTKTVYETIKDKVFFSNISKEIADVGEKLPAAILPGKVLFDGLNLFDGIEGIEDDIQQMHSLLKDGTIVNLEDYYTDNGAFDDDGWDRFIAALERLMTADEFSQYIDKNGIGSELPYPIDENGHAVIPEGTTRIDDYAFLQCDKLVSVSIPNTVEEIGEGAFGSCKNLISITLPSALELIDEAAFFGCEKLASIEIPAGLQRIGARAFAECSSLDDVEIPIGVKVADDAFRDCPCDVAAEISRWNKFKTVKQMTKAVKAAIANGMLRISEELYGMIVIFCTKQYRMVFDYRKNKIFYSIYIKNTKYHSWTLHEEKVLKTFLKMYESSK